jgi:hypothetical protein
MISLPVQVADGRTAQQGGHCYRQGGQLVAAEAGDDRVPGGDVVAGQVADDGPQADPESRADRVQG